MLCSLWASAISNSSIMFTEALILRFPFILGHNPRISSTCVRFKDGKLQASDWWLHGLDERNNSRTSYIFSPFIHKSLSQKTALLNVKKLQGETTERPRFHCSALWLYTGQVESLSSSSENNLFLQKKNWHVLYFVIARLQQKGLQMNEGTVATWHRLWYSHFRSPPRTQSSDEAEQKNTLTKSRLSVGSPPSPPARHPRPRSAARSRSVFRW